MSNMKLSVKDRPAHNLPNNNFAWLTFNKIGQFLLSSVYLNNEHPEVPIRRAVRNSTHVWTQLRQCESDGVKNLIRSYIRSHSFPRTCVLSSTLRRLHSNVIITLRIHVHLTLWYVNATYDTIWSIYCIELIHYNRIMNKIVVLLRA